MLPEVLWAYRAIEKVTTGEALFAIAFSTKVMIPIETRFFSSRVQLFQPELNVQMLNENLDKLEEKGDRAQIRNVAYQQRASMYY